MSEIASWAWKNRDDIVRSLRGIWEWIRGTDRPTPSPGILIFGPGGSGKTTLSKILSEPIDWLADPPGLYTESIGTERVKLTDAPNVEIVIPPGQSFRRDTTWPSLQADLVTEKYRGVIVVASHGLASIPLDSYRDHKLYEGSLPRFLEAMSAEERSEELEVLKRLLPSFQIAKGKLWLLTVVVKQDLWWPEKDDVERHYRDGPYGQLVTAETAKLSPAMFRHELVFASLAISNFRTAKNELLVPNAKGYDQREQVRSLRKLFETVDALRKWETGS
ncbi:MAG: hypothetical protein KF873_00415 [Gemmataceae bacterium]|nr:hypothetical protein [Planctomycetia bacterium]MBX3397173.1 hypothetical protein [Gemmataceae bacterium]